MREAGEARTAADGETFSWSRGDLRELEANFHDERSSRWMYLALADLDRRDGRAAILRELARYEERHAAIWEGVMRSLDHRVPKERRLVEHRVLLGLAKAFGVGAVLTILHKGEVDGIEKYKRQAETWRDPAAQEAFEEILPDEIAHEVDTFNAMREVAGSQGVLRSAILGANDGLGSVLALAAGVAGATGSSALVLIAGVAGIVAGAVSMAASNYVSVKAEQEVYSAQTRIQRDAVAIAPETKRKQLKDAYREKGLTEEEAEAVVAPIAERPEEFLKALLAEEHGISEASFESPSRLAAYTGLAFTLAGAVPVLPFFFLPALEGVIVSVILTGFALFFAGIVRALSSMSPFLRSGVEMVLVGMGAAAATYAVGLAFGGVVG